MGVVESLNMLKELESTLSPTAPCYALAVHVAQACTATL